MPFPIALVAGLAMTGVQFGMASSQASAQNRHRRALQIRRNEQYAKDVQYQKDVMEFQTKRYKAIAESSKTDADQQYATVFDAIQQRRTQAFNSIDKYARESMAGSSRARVTNTETTGQSRNLIQQEFARIESRAAATIHDNLEGYMRQGQRQIKSIRATAQNRINQAMPAPMKPLYPGDAVQGVYQPGGLDLALGLTNTFLSSYSSAAQGAPEGSNVGDIMARIV